MTSALQLGGAYRTGGGGGKNKKDPDFYINRRIVIKSLINLFLDKLTSLLREEIQTELGHQISR